MSFIMPVKIFLPLLRELSATYQSFTAYSAVHIRTLDLTPPQFDIIATLGNTAGMSFKELGDKTLITKGTLTGVVDRLVIKGLVQRVACLTDGRSQIVQLTDVGNALFQRCFPAHLQHIEHALSDLSPADMQTLRDGLRVLRTAFATATSEL
jgi:DNA-binding MarR family transcriptional regulator